MVVILFGVSGAGKTFLGEILARELGWMFYDADNFHPPANIEKMQRGIPLTDEDRGPWLESLRAHIERCIAANESAVLACSALKKKYRDHLRAGEEVKFVFLRGDRALISAQIENRQGHFMNPSLLNSQFADLEEPWPSEDALIIDLGASPRELVNEIKAKLSG